MPFLFTEYRSSAILMHIDGDHSILGAKRLLGIKDLPLLVE